MLVKLFCESLNLDLLEINLEKIKLKSIDDEFNIQNLLDEIQESPKLLKGLRYFYEERPEIAVISAGSLFEIALKNVEFSFQ